MKKQKHTTEKKAEHKTEQHHDIIMSPLIKLGKICKENAVAATTIAAAVLIIFTGIFAYSTYRSKKKESSWAQVYMTQVAPEAERAALLADLQKNFDGTTAAAYAKYMEGEAFYSDGKYEQAAEAYKAAAQSQNTALTAMADLSLIPSLQAAGKTQESVDAAMNFIKQNSGHFGEAQAYLNLSMGFELLGKKEEAKANYLIITNRFPNTYFATFAQNKLKDLK